MELTVLGVDSPFPHKGRATLGYMLRQGSTSLLLEAGFGIYRRLAETGLLAGIDGIFLSHLHCDHCADLPAIILGATAVNEHELPVFLPPGETDRLRQWLSACGFMFILDKAAPIENDYETTFSFGPLEITTSRAKHSLPARMVSFSSGGRRMVYTGDTGDCPEFRRILRGADLALTEVSPLSPEEAEAKGHLTAETLGEIAHEAGVRALVVTHFMAGSDPEALAGEVAGRFGGPVQAARAGEIHRI